MSQLASRRRRGENRCITAFRIGLFWGALALACLVPVAIVAGRGTPEQLIPALVAVGYAFVGRLLVARRPDNAVGWIIAAIAVVLALGGLADGYLGGAPPSDPLLSFQLVALVSWFAWNHWLLALVGIALPLVFPDGRPPSPRWRWVAWVGAGGMLLVGIADGLAPGPIDVKPPVENPFGVAGAGTLLNVIAQVGSTAMAVSVLGAGAAVVVRLRRSRGIERQQVKWFAYVASLIIGGLMVAVVSSSAGDAAWAKIAGPIGWFTALAMVAVGIPVATGFAVLKHRLYDIDVVIKRTLVYGALTAALGGAYVGSVLLLQLLLSPSSDLAIAGSTLAVAALFRPLRTRIQSLVNQRFYRRSYDAAQTVETFGAHLRDEVSLEALSDELRTVVTHTMQPAHVSLWLKGTPR